MTFINHKRRQAILIIYRIFIKRKIQTNVLQMAIMLMDRYLNTVSEEVLECSNIKLIAVTCLFIASKISEDNILGKIDIEDLVLYHGGHAIDYHDIVATEYQILRFFNYDVYMKTFFEKITDFTQIDDKTMIFAIYISFLVLDDFQYSHCDMNLLYRKIINFSILVVKLKSVFHEEICADPVYHHFRYLWKKSYSNVRCPIRKSFSLLNHDLDILSWIQCSDHCENQMMELPMERIKIERREPEYRYRPNFIPREENLREIGGGTYGRIYETLEDHSVVYKIIKSADNSNGITDFMLAEINSLQRLDHPNIIKLLGFHYDANECKLILKLERLQADLYQLLASTVINEGEKRKYILDIVRGVTYMHSQKIMHRDLTACNIMIDNQGTAKIIDFGLSKITRGSTNNYISHPGICSVYYRPIELFMGEKYYNESIDIWSLGCIIYMILFSKMLFGKKDHHDSDVVDEIYHYLGVPDKREMEYLTRLPHYSCFSPPKSAYSRINTPREQKLKRKMAYYPAEYSILSRMLSYLPSDRPKSSEVLDFFENLYTK